MMFWLRGAVRQWERHRFLTLLLIIGYALSIALPTLVVAAISGQMQRETDLAMGDPQRLVSIQLQTSGENSVSVDLEDWLAGIDTTWVRIFFWFRGGDLSPSLKDAHVVAFAAKGEPDWAPPLRTGRFMTATEMQEGAKVMVVGEKLNSPDDLGYQVIGIARDQPEHRSWDRDVFLPLASLPPAFSKTYTGSLAIHVELQNARDLEAAAIQLSTNIRSQIPQGTVLTIITGRDQMEQTAHRFAGAFLGGYGLSAIILGLVIANVGTLSLHWTLRRRRQLGVRLALGATNANIVGMIMFEQISMSLLGALGAAPLIWMGMLLAPQAGIRVSVTGREIIVATIATLLSGCLAAVLPLRTVLGTPLSTALHVDD